MLFLIFKNFYNLNVKDVIHVFKNQFQIHFSKSISITCRVLLNIVGFWATNLNFKKHENKEKKEWLIVVYENNHISSMVVGR